jgi:hypothetical protein
MDLLGRPAADVGAAVQENFQQPDDAGLVDLDAGIAHRAYDDRQGDALQQRKVDVNVEPLRLEGGEAASDGLELFADRLEMVQAFLETEVVEIVGAQFVAQKRGELFVLLQERVLEIGAKDMVTMLDLIDDGGKLAGQPTMEALTIKRNERNAPSNAVAIISSRSSLVSSWSGMGVSGLNHSLTRSASSYY